MNEVALITGFPKTELACWVLASWLETHTEGYAFCVVPPAFQREAEHRLRRLTGQRRARVRLLQGDAAAMDMGLSSVTLKEVTRDLGVIHHCAAMCYSGVPPARAMAFNAQAAREAVELALVAPKLRRLVHWSSTRAVGSVDGCVREDSLQPPSGGSIAYSRYLAECIMREAADALPVTVVRTASLVGDTQTGSWPRMEGVYLIARTLLLSSPDTSVALPARRNGLLSVVPVDFAAQAGCVIADHPSSKGRTFHVVDPEPVTVTRAFKLFAELTGRPEPRRGLPSPLARAILHAPGIARIAHGPRDLLDDLGRRARCDQSHARAILVPAGMRCPTLAEYAPQIVSFLRTAPRSSLSTRMRSNAVPSMPP